MHCANITCIMLLTTFIACCQMLRACCSVAQLVYVCCVGCCVQALSHIIIIVCFLYVLKKFQRSLCATAELVCSCL